MINLPKTKSLLKAIWCGLQRTRQLKKRTGPLSYNCVLEQKAWKRRSQSWHKYLRLIRTRHSTRNREPPARLTYTRPGVQADVFRFSITGFTCFCTTTCFSLIIVIKSRHNSFYRRKYDCVI